TMAKYRGELLITPPHDDGHWTLLDTCRHRATWWRRNPRNSDVPRRDIVPELGSDRGESHPPYPRVARIVNASMFRTVRPRVHKCATFCPECRKIVDLQFRTLYGSEAKAQVRSKLQRVASIKHKVMGCVRKEWFSAVGLQLPVNLSPRARVWTHPGHADHLRRSGLVSPKQNPRTNRPSTVVTPLWVLLRRSMRNRCGHARPRRCAIAAYGFLRPESRVWSPHACSPGSRAERWPRSGAVRPGRRSDPPRAQPRSA